MFLPEILDLRGYSGTPVHVDLTVRDTDGNPVSVVGATWLAQVRYNPAGPLITTFAVTPIAPLLGQVRLTLTGAQTAAVHHPAVWDVHIIPAGQTEPVPLRRGAFVITRGVSRG